MLEPLKKTILATLGVVAFSKEKLQRLLKELEERGELSAEQAKKLFEFLHKRGDDEGQNLAERVLREVERFLEKGPLATRAELRALQERVEALESQAHSHAEEPSSSAIDS